ncbi:MAG: PIN domain-containing protein [Actinomycetota bacterium]|nr:PIN domain-containing protein [Actinomycetota bacterium]
MIFVDTSIWFDAVAGTTSRAERASQALNGHRGQLASSAAVLTELWNLLAVRGHLHRATPVCLTVADGAEILHAGPDDHAAALAVLRGWADQRFSYADALSFALMERERIDAALTQDHHFRTYRYGPGRRRAFRVLPD